MTLIKLKKAWLKDFETLLRKTGLIYQNFHAFPCNIYVSQEDYKTLCKNSHKGMTKLSFSFFNLQLSPAQKLQKVLKPGWAVIDDCAIKKYIAELRIQSYEQHKSGTSGRVRKRSANR